MIDNAWLPEELRLRAADAIALQSLPALAMRESLMMFATEGVRMSASVTMTARMTVSSISVKAAERPRGCSVAVMAGSSQHVRAAPAHTEPSALGGRH